GRWHADEAAKDARPSVADVIEQHDDDVGRARGRLVRPWKIRLRISIRQPDLSPRKPMLWFGIELSSDSLGLAHVFHGSRWRMHQGCKPRARTCLFSGPRLR